MPDFREHRRKIHQGLSGQPQAQQPFMSDMQVRMLNAQRGQSIMAHKISRATAPATGAARPHRAASSRDTNGDGVISAGERVDHIERPDGSLIPVAAATGDPFLVRPKGADHYVSPGTGNRFKVDPASPTGLSSIGSAREEAMRKAAEAQAKKDAAAAKLEAKAADDAEKATEKANKDAKRLENAKATDKLIAEGRAYHLSRETGTPLPMQTDEEFKASKSEKMSKLQQDAAAKPFKKRLAELQLELDNPDLPKVSEKDQKDADEEHAAATTELMAQRGNDDLSTPLTDDEVKAAQADPLRKDAAVKYLAAKEKAAMLPKHAAKRKALEKEVYETKKRILDPLKYAADLKAEAPLKSDDELKAHASEIDNRIKARNADVQQEQARITQKDDQFSQQYTFTKQQYDAALAGGDPNVIGTLGDSMHDIEQQMLAWQGASQDQRAAVDAQADQIKHDAGHLQILADEVKKREATRQSEYTAALDAALPGAGKRYGDVLADGQKRTQDLAEKYPDPFAPEAKAAFDALHKDFTEKTSEIAKEAQAKATERTDDLRAASVAIARNGFKADNTESMEKAGLDPKNPAHVAAFYDANALHNLHDGSFAKVVWEPSDKISKGFGTAVLSDGSLHVAPEFYHDPAKYAAVVEASDATPKEKAKAMAELPRLQMAFAEAALPVLKEAGSTAAAKWIPGIASFQKWQKEKPRKGTEVEQANEYLTEMNARGGFAKASDNVIRSILSGFADIGTMTAGSTALLTGSKGLSEWAGGNAARTNAFNAPISMEGGASGIGSAILGQTARMAGPMAAQLLITRGLGGGMASMAALSAGQTAGSQYAESYNKLREGGMSHKEAWKRAAPFALASGAVTAMIDAAGGRTGFAAALGHVPGSKAALEAAKHAADGYWKNLARNVPREALAEIPKEFPDEMFSQISQAIAEDPHANINEVVGNFMANAPAFLGAVALMGGSGGVMETNQEFKQKASDQPPAADLTEVPESPAVLPEHTAAIGSAIDNWTPTGSLPSSIQDATKAAHGKEPTPEQHADTARTAAHALVDIANGQDPRAMSPEVRRALGIKTNSKTGAIEPLSKSVAPLVDSVEDTKGNHQPVITDAARAWLAQEVPGAGEAVKLSYAERVEQIKNPPKAAKKIVAKKAPKEKVSTPEAATTAGPEIQTEVKDGGTISPDGATPTPTSPSGETPKLPRELASAKPAYSYGQKQFKLEFESDVDRAAYISAQQTPSKRDADYLAFAMQHTGMAESAVRAHGATVRAYIKGHAATGKHGDTILIPAQLSPVDVAAHQAATSPKNETPHPTDAQAKAGNYPMGHVNLSGLNLTIENPDGSKRKWTNEAGETGENTMKGHYGYIKSTVGADGDHIDALVKAGTPTDWNGDVYVIKQNKPDGTFDEDKLYIGFDSEAAAKAAYLSNYQPGWKGYGGAIAVSVEDLSKMVKAGELKKNLQQSEKPQPAQQEKAPRGTNEPIATAPEDRKNEGLNLEGGALLAAAEKASQAVVSKLTGAEKQRAVIARDAILATIRRYNGHLPIDLSKGSDGFSFSQDGKILINVREAIGDVVRSTSSGPEAKSMAEKLFDHEVIHLFAVSKIDDKRVMGVWKDLPQDVKDAVIKAYSIRRVAMGQPAVDLNDFAGGHEYFRAMIEATRTGVLSEQAIGSTLAAKWKQIVLDFLAILKDLKRQFASIKSEAKRAELTARVEAIRKEISDALDQFERSITPQENNSPGSAESALTSGAGAGSISTKPPSSSGLGVASDTSLTNEKESSGSLEAEAVKAGIPAKEVTTPESVKAKQPVDPKALREMKRYLLEKIDDAIATAGDPSQPKVVIEIPGDGTFTLHNNKKTLQEFAKKVKSFPTATPAATAPKLTEIRPSGIPVLNKGKVTTATLVKVAGAFASTDDTRQSIMQVADFGDILVATDGRMMFTAPIPGEGTEKDPMLYSANGARLGPQSKNEKFGKYPGWQVAIPQDAEVIYRGLDTGRLWQILKQASAVYRDTNWKVVNGKGQTENQTPYVQIFINPDNTIGVRGEADNRTQDGGGYVSNIDVYEHNIQSGAKIVGRFDADLLMTALAAFRAIGQEKVSIKSPEDKTQGAMVLTSRAAEVVLMRVRGATPSEKANPEPPKTKSPAISPPEIKEDAPSLKFKPVPGAENSARAMSDSRYPYKFKGYASTNEGGFLSVDAGGDTEQGAKDAAMSLLSDRWHLRESKRTPSATPKAQPPAVPKSGASKESLDKIKGAFDSLNANPAPESKAQIGLPKDRRAAFLDVAESLIADGVNTPEGLAAALTEARPDGSLQKYSQALWNFFGTIDPDLTGQHDWQVIYAPVDNPASDATIPNESDMVQRPGSAESGDAGSTGGTITEGSADSGRVGSDESSTPTQDGEGENAAAEGSGGAEPTSTGSGTSGGGRDNASIGPRDSGDVRSEHATVNYSITDADKIGEGGLKTKYADNVAAIKLVKELQSSGRKPTTAEQKILVRYVGWGGLKGVFDPTNKTWKDQHAEIKGLLTEDEYAAAKRSRLDAHFTSPTVIKNGIWGALRRFGFTGGKMLEGGVGIGHMIGLMPASVRPASSYLGIEKDPITAQIAAYLYPEASIHSAGFEKATVERDHFDAAAGNPPFGQQQLYDPLFKAASKFSIHNYFIAKHIEALRPGGVGAWVVSHNFLDALDPAAREYIASKAEFLGAIRLPNTAFKGNANTEVTTDIVYFRRVAEGTDTNTDWTKATKQSDKDGNAYSLNDWINNHRDMILGTLDTTGSMYGPGELTVTAPPAQDLAQDIAAAVENLPADVYDNGTGDANIRLATPEYIPVPNEVRVGAYFIGEKGELRRRLSDANMERRSAPVEVAEGAAERIRGMVEVRDAFNKVVSAELDNNATPAALDSLRAELNRAYDAFVKKHGLLHQTGNRRAFFSDPHAARILGLESDYDSGVSAATAKKNSVPVRKPTAKKADIFNRRVNSPYSEITKVDTSKEALTVALNQRGAVDLDYMTQLSGIDRDTLLRELDGLIFETPQGEWQVASQYLSGNVRKKLHDAEAAAQDDPRFTANVEALKAVQPPDLEATQVTVTPGAPWVMSDVLKQFAKDLTGEDATSAVYNSANGGWIFNHPSNGTNSTQVWGTPKADFGTLFANILNNKPTIIHLPRGKDDPLVVDAHATALAQAKSDAIREKWATWVWEDQARRDSLLRIYNDKYNVYVDPKYDGSHLTLPGISNVVTLRPHQKDVVWRIMTDLTTLLDHVVGAGKTFAGVAAFMELRRLGRVRKPMFAVPNHLVTQWRDDFVKLYPNANVLFARPSDFKKDKRQQLFAKIMTGEYDAVIVGHSSLKKIGMSPQVEGELLREMLKEIVDTLAAVAEAEGKRGSRAQTQLERQKEALEAKLARLADIGGADEVATFEELGIDGLFVDEAHEFKNLFYTTQMQNVAGLGNPAGSGKAFDLYLKTRHLRKRYGGKAPVVFATGTPISNSLVEMFTMQRYLQPEVLESMDITTLDAWAKVFATVKQVYEVNPTGTGMRLATRLAQFQNVGDLSAVYRTVADVITMSDLHAQAEAQGKKFPIPKVKGGKPKIYAVDRTPEQESYFGVETQRTTASGEPIYDGEGNPIFEYPEGSINWRVDNMPDDPREDNMLKLTSDARKAALDMRLVNPDAADRPESKINTTVRNILATAKEWDAEKGTQLVFCDLSVPSSARGKAKAKAVEAISAISWVRFHDKIVRVENVTPVTIPGFEEFEFFVRKDGKEWSVTERSSGVRVSSGSSKAEAVANAASRVTPMGVDKFRTAVESHRPSTEDLAAFFASQEEAPAKEADTEEADVADDTETTVSMDELLAEESSFSVYDDLKAKLIAGGLLPNQVEFIHDHDSPEKKSILFARMNKGDVRVLIGSTPKLGAGTNVQRKLVALHHMDAPWRPSDLEQREGRIIRQGNEFYEADPEGFEVSINRYATKMTYDTRMWQIIEHKAAGIEGFRRAERTTRVLEDVSGEAANAAEMKAASSGDPRIAREIMLRGEIMKLQNLFDGWRQNRWRTESRVNALGDHPNTHASLKKNRLELIAKRDAATTEEFSYQLPGGNKVDKKADILAPIAEIVKAAPDGERIAIGRYRGFMFAVTRRKARGGDYYFEIEAAPIGSNSTQYRGVSYLYKSDDLSATGLIQRFDNYLSGFEGDITRDAEGVIRSLKERDELQATLKDTFKDEAKLEEMKAEHATLRAELMQSRGKREAAPAPDKALKAPPAGRDDPGSIRNAKRVPYRGLFKNQESSHGRAITENLNNRARAGRIIRSFERDWKPFFTYIDDTAPEGKRKDALRKIVNKFGVNSSSPDSRALWEAYANMPIGQLVPEDTERVKEAKELLPYLENLTLGQNPSAQNQTTKDIHEIRNHLKEADAGRHEYPVPPERLKAQAESLLRWAEKSGKTINREWIESATARHDGLGGGEEHDVWLPKEAGGRVIKLTKPNAYGIQQDLTRYLDTIEGSNARFGDDIQIEGVVVKDGWPHILISQPFYSGAMASQKEIDAFFKDQGYQRFNDGMYRDADETMVYDAFPRNVLKLTDGKTMPIDVQVRHAEGRSLHQPPSGYRTPTSMLAGTAATMKGMQKPAAPSAPAAPAFNTKDLHAAYQRAIHGTSTAFTSIRSVFDAAKKDQPSLSADEFKSQLKADYYAGLVGLEPADSPATTEKAGQFTMRDSLGVVHTNMVFMPTTEAEAMDAAERDVTSTPDQILSDWAGTGEALGQNPVPIDPAVANQGDTDENREAFARARGSYITNELTKANFDEIRQKVEDQIDEDEQGMLDNIQYKVANDGELSLEEEIARRMLANTLRTRGVRENDQAMVTLADSLWGQDIRDATETARKLAVRVDQFQSPQERLDAAMGRIIAPNRSKLRARLTTTWSPSTKRREIARLEAEKAEATTDASRSRLEKTLAEAKARMDHNDIIDKMAAENNEAVDKALKRLGLTQADLTMTPDDRHALQTAVLDLPQVKNAMVTLSPEVQKAIEMSVRGYTDAAIARDTGLKTDVVERVTEHFRNVTAKQAVSQAVTVGKQTLGGLIEGGKNLIRWILKAPPAPLQNMVNMGVKNAANVQAQVQAILNAAIPTRRNRNRRALHAAVVNGKKGQKITVFVPYDPTDWQQVYRVARELSTREATVMNKAYEYWINGILSGPQTHVVNTASNTLSTLWHYGPQWFASATVNTIIRDPNSTQWGEFPKVWAGFLKGIQPAMANFALAWRTEADPVESTYLDRPVTVMFNDASLEKAGGGRGPSIGGLPGRIIRSPGRFLVAMDAFAKTLIMHGEVSAYAYRLGKQRGLAGVALENFMASQIATHGSESWEHSLQTAKELTFQDENDITQAVEKVTNSLKQAKYVGLLFKFLLPFVRTPTNIYRAGMRKAGGSAGLLLYRLGKAGFYQIKDGTPFFASYTKGKMVQDVSESVMAGIMWMGAMMLSEGDPEDEKKWIEFTGSRPHGVANAGERASQLRQEGGSNLIIIRKNPVTGEKLADPIRIPIGGYEPMALTIGTLTDAAREFKEWSRLPGGEQTADKLASAIMQHIIAQAQDKTFLQGISSASQLLEDLTQNRLSIGESLGKQIVTGVIPNFIRQPMRQMRPEMADSKKPHEILGSKLLGGALSDAESKVNEAGKAVTRRGGPVGNVLFPGATEPSKALFDTALKDWNARHPGEKWNPDTITKGDWYLYDPATGSKKGKFPLKDSRQISLFEKNVGIMFDKLAAQELTKAGYRPGAKVTPAQIKAIKDARTAAIKRVRSMPPSAFTVKTK